MLPHASLADSIIAGTLWCRASTSARSAGKKSSVCMITLNEEAASRRAAIRFVADEIVVN
jgi:hypothetical protein